MRRNMHLHGSVPEGLFRLLRLSGRQVCLHLRQLRVEGGQSLPRSRQILRGDITTGGLLRALTRVRP